MIKIAQVVGARPQFIKYSPVYRAIETLNASSGESLTDILIHTGQHYDYNMSKVFFDEMRIKEPDYNLGVGSGAHGAQTGHTLQKVEEVLLKERPDAVVIYGDTNSTLGGALAAAKLHIPVVHVEAGLRSYNRYMPEELNRLLADHASTLLLCPTVTAVENLKREGFASVVNEGRLITADHDFSSYKAGINNPLVVNIGDVMYDVLLSAAEIAEKKSDILKSLNLNGKQYYILTIHRAENTGDDKRLKDTVDFVNDMTADTPVIFPVHPGTRKRFENIGKKFKENVRLIPPLGYFDMLWLLSNSSLAFTDSGGLQKEAYWLRVPCITLREETEWVETVQSGWNALYREYKGTHTPSDMSGFLYGDGKAAEKIVSVLMKTLGKDKK